MPFDRSPLAGTVPAPDSRSGRARRGDRGGRAGLLVLVTLLDAFDTLLATHLAGLGWSLSGIYYAVTWRSYRALCARIGDDHRREQALGLFGPASFIGLLLVWTTASIAGWGLVWWGVRSQFSVAPESVGDAFYYAGVAYFSIGFGDLLPGSTLTKALSILAAMDGLGTLGLVIGYLPTLSAAYKERESQLLLLDDLTDARITPVSLILSHVGPDGDTTELDAHVPRLGAVVRRRVRVAQLAPDARAVAVEAPGPLVDHRPRRGHRRRHRPHRRHPRRRAGPGDAAVPPERAAGHRT